MSRRSRAPLCFLILMPWFAMDLSPFFKRQCSITFIGKADECQVRFFNSGARGDEKPTKQTRRHLEAGFCIWHDFGWEIENPYGSHPTGLLTYTEDGHVTAMIS